MLYNNKIYVNVSTSMINKIQQPKKGKNNKKVMLNIDLTIGLKLS